MPDLEYREGCNMKRLILVLSAAIFSFCAYPVAAIADTASNTDNMSDNSALTAPAGPMRVSLTHSDQFGSLIKFKWDNHVTENSAFGFALDFGAREFLLGGTFGYALTPSQRFKITAEHLAQNFDFDFVARDETGQYVGQNLGGLVYEYLLPNPNLLHSVDVGAYVAKTENETFTPVVFTAPFGQQRTDIRNLAGGKSRGGEAGVNLLPWNNAFVNADLNYDLLTFATYNQAARNKSGLGATLGLTQIVTDHFKVDAAASDRAAFSELQVGANYLLPAKPGRILELGLMGRHVSGDLFTGSENRVMLGLAFSWGGSTDLPPATYSIDRLTNLINWTDQPAMALPEVFLQKDEGIR